MLTLKIDTQLYEFPTAFEEIDKKLFPKIASQIYSAKNPFLAKKNAFLLFVPLPKKVRKHLNAEQWYELIKLLDFLFEPCGINFIESFTVENIAYFLPAKSMEFSSLIEYAMADECLQRYADGDSGALGEMIFTLCRPKDTTIDTNSPLWNGDIRERYNSALVARRKTTEVPAHIAFFIVLFMLGIKKELSEIYPELFPIKETEEGEEQGEREPQTEPNIISWLKIIKVVAETGLYGNYEQTCHTNLHTFCLNLCFDIEQREKMKTQKPQADEIY